MKREPRTVTECCPHCNRDGWTHRVPYALFTEEEQIDVLGRIAKEAETMSWPKSDTLPTYERAWVHAGATVFDAIREGIELSREIHKPVLFRFNGVAICCTGESDPERLVREYDVNLRRDGNDFIR